MERNTRQTLELIGEQDLLIRPDLLEDRLRPLLGALAEPALIEAQIDRIYGEGHYERISYSQQLLSLPTYTGISLEAGNVWEQLSDLHLNDLIYSGSVYIGVGTPLGPVFLGYGQSSESRRAIYLTFGNLIQSRQVQQI